MKPFALLFLALFGGASAVNVLSEINEWQWGIYLSKPLLMTFLGLYFFTVTQVKTNFSRRILTGLIFSLAGDTLLMFNAPGREHFFLLGLAAFLCAHLAYILAFWGYEKNLRGAFYQQPLLALPFLAFLGVFLSYLWPDIPAGLKAPVALYSSIIITMSMACFQLRTKLNSKLFWGLFSGVLLFVFSDSLIAISKFSSGNQVIPDFIRPLIMITYIAAQYLIASRSVEMDKTLK
jgi:uncharacterized membrane protein YhhN